jgi:hypothetical protein
LLHCVLGIDHGDDGVKQVMVGHVIVDEEGLGDRPRIGKTCGFDHHPLEGDFAGAPALLQVVKDANQITTHGAAYASVVHLHDLLVAILNEEFVVDAFLAKLVLDYSDPVAVLLREDSLEERGFATA